jgi:hypothetical protein
MKAIAVAVLFIVAFSHCTTKVSPQTKEGVSDELTVRTGTSFGMCIGDHCVSDYVFNGTNVTLTHKSQRPQQQPASKSCQFTISQTDWNTIKANVNLDAFGKQPARIGCPDCADGGAEYVELELGDQKHRVTFPYGETIPGFESLVSKLREHRDAFQTCQ